VISDLEAVSGEWSVDKRRSKLWREWVKQIENPEVQVTYMDDVEGGIVTFSAALRKSDALDISIASCSENPLTGSEFELLDKLVIGLLGTCTK